jgi:hypothetical protein
MRRGKKGCGGSPDRAQGCECILSFRCLFISGVHQRRRIGLGRRLGVLLHRIEVGARGRRGWSINVIVGSIGSVSWRGFGEKHVPPALEEEHQAALDPLGAVGLPGGW